MVLHLLDEREREPPPQFEGKYGGNAFQNLARVEAPVMPRCCVDHVMHPCVGFADRGFLDEEVEHSRRGRAVIEARPVGAGLVEQRSVAGVPALFGFGLEMRVDFTQVVQRRREDEQVPHILTSHTRQQFAEAIEQERVDIEPRRGHVPHVDQV